MGYLPFWNPPILPAIEVHELHRRERRRVFDASRTVLVVDRLAEEQRRRRFELHLRQEAAKEKREQSRQRRWRVKTTPRWFMEDPKNG